MVYLRLPVLVRKASLDFGMGQFLNQILPFVCWKRGKFFLKVNKNDTSQECSNCGCHTGKKQLSERVHQCQHCGYLINRDVCSAEVIRNRGINAVGQTVLENACGDGLAGVKQLNLFDLVKNL